MINRIKKYAFTLAEAIVTFTLIGIIFLASISNMDLVPRENYDKLYWQAFNTLLQAAMSYEKDWETESISKCLECETNKDETPTCYRSECWRNSTILNCDGCEKQERFYQGGTKNIDRDFPGFLYDHSMANALIGWGQDRIFCNKFVEKINTHPSGRCESFISIVNPSTIKSENSTEGVKFLDAFSFCNLDSKGECSSIVNSEGGISPSFVALNGQKFYISSVVSANTSAKLGEEWRNFAHQNRESYRFVVVDLNGDTKPNSQFKKGSRNPDIVLFAINSIGQVIPIGYPEFSKSYINAIVYYPNDLNEDGSRTYPNTKSSPMSLWDAKKYAFGNQSCGAAGAPLPYGSAVSRIEPLSQSAKFYAVANTCKNKVADCGNKNTGKDEIYADKLFVHLVMQFLYKAEGSNEIHSFLTNDKCIKNDIENGCDSISSENEEPPCAIGFEH